MSAPVKRAPAVRPRLVWAVVQRSGKIVSVGVTRDEAIDGFHYMIEIEQCRVVRVQVASIAPKVQP